MDIQSDRLTDRLAKKDARPHQKTKNKKQKNKKTKKET